MTLDEARKLGVENCVLRVALTWALKCAKLGMPPEYWVDVAEEALAKTEAAGQ